MLATAESKNQAVSKLEALIERGRSRASPGPLDET